jgi:translation initiation factor IF-3
MLVKDAITLAQSQGLDLVEIAESAVPPVVKIIDFGKFRYEKEKSLKENKKKQKVVILKEIKIRPQIDQHDLEIKSRKVDEFLADGKKVKILLTLRGRQHLHTEKGKELLEELAVKYEGISVVERFYSGAFYLILTPKNIK